MAIFFIIHFKDNHVISKHHTSFGWIIIGSGIGPDHVDLAGSFLFQKS
ncbi:MAG: hypothetical protein HN379_04805 [Desulfobacteraceae bacterium]|nr:hypothetical protein [Desulfobacteraceae bacterium]MBT4363847.1 hypothetical protein [Desulfobacteraceae bacterium]